MSLAGLGPKTGSRHVCLIITETGQKGPVLYKEDKGVNVAARPTEAGDLFASSLPWSINRPARMPDIPLNSQQKKKNKKKKKHIILYNPYQNTKPCDNWQKKKKKKKENLLSRGFSHPIGPQSKNQIVRKKR